MGPATPPNKVGLKKWRFLGRLTWREAVGEDNEIMLDLEYCDRKGESAKERKGLTFTLSTQTQIRNFGQFLFVPPYLIIGPVLFQLCTKDLEYSKQCIIYSI